MIVCTFWTNDVYEGYAAGLEKSCRAFGLPYYGARVPDRGSWKWNLHYKPVFIKLTMEGHKDDVLWLDADSVIRGRPTALEGGEFDAAAYFEKPNRPWGGTLFFRNNGAARGVLERWSDYILEQDPSMDQDVLPYVLGKSYEVKVRHLPPSYCWVERWFRRRFSGSTPVIEQFAIGEA
jgi:hypothetical protein